MNNWIIKESNNYRFHYHKNSEVYQIIDEIIHNQEICFKHICKVLNINFDTKINYYLCNSPEEVGNLYGDNEPCNAFARKPNEIFAMVNKDIKCIGYHEDTHIISYSISIPPQVFIREGLAMYFDKYHLGFNNLNWVAYFIDTNKYISISQLILDDEFYKYNWAITYPIAGAFTEYLITMYGIEKYKEFYKKLSNDFEHWFYKIYGISISEFENDFIEYINSFKSNKKVFKLLEDLI